MFEPAVQFFPEDVQQTLISIREAFSHKQLNDFCFCVATGTEEKIHASDFSSNNFPDKDTLDVMYPKNNIIGVIIKAVEQVIYNMY
jgi:hypothetical protein